MTKKYILRASLVAWWSRIHLSTQETCVWSLVQEDPRCHGTAGPMCHNYWACALEPVSRNYRVHMPQLLKLACLQPMLHNMRNQHNEKLVHHNWRVAPNCHNQRKYACSNEDPVQSLKKKKCMCGLISNQIMQIKTTYNFIYSRL